MGDAKHTPDDNVFVLDQIPPLDGVRHPIDLALALERISTSRVELTIAVFRHPHVMLRELGSSGLSRLWVRQEKLCCEWREFVAHLVPADGVDLVGIDHLDDPIELRSGVEPAGPLHGSVSDLVEITSWVGSLVHPHRVRLLQVYRILVTVDGRVDSHAEEVLVILGQHPLAHYISIVTSLARIDAYHTENARRSDFDGDTARLVEPVCEDILVVGERDDELHHELPVPDHHRTSCSPNRVLPTDAIILFVKTNHIW